MAVNAAGRDIPSSIPGYGEVRPYQGAFARVPEGFRAGGRLKAVNGSCRDKRLKDIEAAIVASGHAGDARAAAHAETAQCHRR